MTKRPNVTDDDVPSVDLSPIAREKLDNPHMKLTTDESIAVITSCVAFGEAQVAKAKGRDLLMVIGNTGAGKSTFVNFLAGCVMELISRGDAGVGGDDDEDIVRVKPGSPHPFRALAVDPYVMAIGHSDESATFLPNVVYDPVNILTYCDCPGFVDNRGFEINIANAVNIKRTIAAGTSVRVLILLKYFESDKGRSVKELIKILRDLFGGDVRRLVNAAPAILLGVNKVPLKQGRRETLVELSNVVKKVTNPSSLSEEEAELVQMLSPRMFVCDPLGKGNETWLTREQLRDRIKALEPITDPSAIFSTVLTTEDEQALHHIVDEMTKRVIAALESKKYGEAADSLTQLYAIELIDNVRVTRMLNRTKDTLRNHVHALEREATKLAMLEAFERVEQLLAQLEQADTQLSAYLPEDLDAASIASTLRAFCDARKTRQQEDAEFQRLFRAMKEKHADAIAQLGAQQKLLEGQIKANAEIKEENDEKIRRLQAAQEAAEQRAEEQRRLMEAANQARLADLEAAMDDARGKEKEKLQRDMEKTEEAQRRRAERAAQAAADEKAKADQMILQMKEANANMQEKIAKLEEDEKRIQGKQAEAAAEEQRRLAACEYLFIPPCMVFPNGNMTRTGKPYPGL